ncbi:MAG: RNA polymerase sigma factor [Pseudomonadota bacterium]
MTAPAFDPLDGVADEDLLARYAAGDQSAARALTERHAARVLSVAQRMLGDRAEAEDITQEAMLRLWKIAPSWETGRAKVSTWLYRVASNLCIDRIRAHKPIYDAEPPDMADEAPGTVERLEEADRATALHAALATLPDRQRLAMTLKFLEDLPNPEIATIMDLSVDAVESLVARGKRALAQRLEPQRHALGHGTA